MGFKIKNGLLKLYHGFTSDVIIPSCVTKISGFAFEKNKYLKSVIITRNVKSIEYNAFKECTNLEKVIIMNGVTKIGTNAFSGTKWLENKQATEKNAIIINGIAIAKAKNIGESVNLEGVKEIPDDIFKYCE